LDEEDVVSNADVRRRERKKGLGRKAWCADDSICRHLRKERERFGS
jgi:hypothetical protein